MDAHGYCTVSDKPRAPDAALEAPIVAHETDRTTDARPATASSEKLQAANVVSEKSTDSDKDAAEVTLANLAKFPAVEAPADLSTSASKETCSTIAVIIQRAKFNFKYKKAKKTRPRLNADDMAAIELMLEGTRATYTYDPETNDLCFDTHVAGDSNIIIDGLDTGGQVIRTALSLAINISGGRVAPLRVLEIGSPQKACMLYVQAAMHTLKVGDSFTIWGGSPTNPDAPSFEDYGNIFKVLRGLLGVSYRLVDQSDADGSKFLLSRDADGERDPNWDHGDKMLSVYMLDQILMALVFVKPGVCVTLRGDYDQDYHVPAMIKLLRLLGHSVDDIIENWQRRCIRLLGPTKSPTPCQWTT